MKKRTSRLCSFTVVAVVYLLAFIIFLLVYHLTSGQGILAATFLGDVTATVFVWFLSMLFKNASLYDPYWSVAPLAIVPFWMVVRRGPLDMVDILFLAAVFFWGIRLTLNWAVRWSGLHHQDWRYTKYQKKLPRLWPLVSLTGIQLMPTVLVFLGIVPVYTAIFYGEAPRFLLWIGLFLCIGAATIQLIADRQMDTFKSRSPAKEVNIDEGLWRYSRHPNYLGEIIFWWGLWIMQVGVNHTIWYTVAAPLLITLLFIFISIPMMERHILASRPSYVEYRQAVPPLLPWFRK